MTQKQKSSVLHHLKALEKEWQYKVDRTLCHVSPVFAATTKQYDDLTRLICEVENLKTVENGQ